MIGRFLFGGLVGAVLLGTPSRAWALGAAAIGDEVVSARSVGGGQIGTAGRSDDPATAYLNPAGMTALPGTQAELGLTAVHLGGTYHGDDGQDSRTVDNSGAVPNFACTHFFARSGLSVGLSLESPFGFKYHWPLDGPLRYSATTARFYMGNVSPAVAYQINSAWSIGVAADYVNAFDVLQERRLNAAPYPDGNLAFSGSGTSWGMHAGLTFSPTPRHTVGIVYHEKMKLTINGHEEIDGLPPPIAALMGGTNYQTAASADLFLPQNVQMGYAYQPDDRWTFEVDTAWYDWSSNRDVNVRVAETDPNRLAVLNTDNPTPLHRQNGWTAAAGVNYKMSDTWQWRGGIGYLPNATPETTFQPGNDDLTRFGFCMGAGWKFSPHWGIDLGYSAVFENTRHISNSLAPEGRYGNMVHLLALDLTLNV